MANNDASHRRSTRERSSIHRIKRMDFGVTVARAVCSVASIVVAGLAVPSAARAADLFQADSPVRGMVVPAPDAQEAADIAEFRLLLFLQERIHIVNVGQTSDSKFLVLWQEVPIDAPDPLLASFGSPRAPDSSGFAGGISVRGLSITGAITGTTDVDGGIPQGTARLRPQRAYRWTQSGGLVALPVPAGFDLSGGTAISATGSTVVGQISRAGDNQTALGAAQQAFRWTSALGTQSLGADTTAATGVNINGTVVVGNTSKTFSRAFRWDLSDPATGAGSLTALAPLAAAGAQAYSFAYGVSTSGQVVVGASQAATFDGPLLPVSWTGSAAPVSSGLAPGTTSGAALAVSGTGDVIVGLASTSAIDGSSEPDFRIQPDGLLTLANNGRTANLTAARAIRWTQATGWQTLNDVAKANGIDTTGITFLTAETVSHDGQFIAGAAVFPTTVVIPGFKPEGYILRICDATTAAACAAFNAHQPLQPAWPAAQTASDRVFNYLEATYPQFVAPKGAASALSGGIYFRYYAATNAYLGTLNGNLYALVPAVDGQVHLLGSLSDWLAVAAAAGF
jgi:hypothetical protein